MSFTTNVRQTQSYDAKVTTCVRIGARKYLSAQKAPEMQMLYRTLIRKATGFERLTKLVSWFDFLGLAVWDTKTQKD